MKLEKMREPMRMRSTHWTQASGSSALGWSGLLVRIFRPTFFRLPLATLARAGEKCGAENDSAPAGHVEPRCNASQEPAVESALPMGRRLLRATDGVSLLHEFGRYFVGQPVEANPNDWRYRTTSDVTRLPGKADLPSAGVFPPCMPQSSVQVQFLDVVSWKLDRLHSPRSA